MGGLGNKEIMAKNIKRLMEEREIDRVQICNDLNFKYTTFSDWINANTYPRIDKIELMANYFRVSKADLVEEYNPLTKNNVVINDTDLAIIQRERNKMTDKDKVKLMNILKANFDEYNWEEDDSGNIN